MRGVCAQAAWKRRGEAASAVGGAALAAALAFALAAPAAWAGELPEGQAAAGSTRLVLEYDSPGEYGGTGGYATGGSANPDGDGDGLGDNIMFTVPTRIVYAAKATGEMVGASTYIENHSVYQVRVSAMQVAAGDGWTVVEDATATDAPNAVDFAIGPEGGRLLASEHLAKADVANPAAWNMSFALEAGDADKVQVTTAGHMNNVAKNLDAGGDKFAEVQWYVRPGNAD